MPIEIINLDHSYKQGTPFEQQVLFNINLKIDDGEFVGVIGPTRSGKSTMAQHINALHVPLRGRVIVDGFDTADKKTDLVSLRHRVGYVFQNPDYQLFAPTVGEDIAFGPSNQKLPHHEIKTRVEDAMHRVGLDKSLLKRDIYALSGGQKRRAAIAGVLACRPKILVLDDVTAGLDPRGRKEIIKVIKDLHRDRGITIIFISNSMEEIALMAERIIVMDGGRVIMDGPTSSVFSRTEELRNIGLELPEATVLTEKLRSAGFDLPAGVLNDEDVMEAIAAGFRHKEVNKTWN